MDDLEKFCKDRAENLNWSQNMCAQALGMSKWKFRLLLPHMKIRWPKTADTVSHRESNRNRVRNVTPAMLDNLSLARERRFEKLLVMLDGVSATVHEHARRYPLSASTYRRRVQASMADGLTRQEAAERAFAIR